MPIRPELRHFYRGPAWRATRERILARAENRCEQCGKPNGRYIRVLHVLGVQLWAIRNYVRKWRSCKTNQIVTMYKPQLGRQVRVVLTVAHLNHKPGDDRDENLKLLCQWCHLNYDKLHHRDTRAERKDRARPLLGAA